jgi:hypothetical protein
MKDKKAPNSPNRDTPERDTPTNTKESIYPQPGSVDMPVGLAFPATRYGAGCSD